MNQYGGNICGYRLCDRPQNLMSKRIVKEECKMMIDVLEKSMNRNANTEQEKQHNAGVAFVCKALIETLWQ